MDTDGILCYRCLTKRGESTDSFDVGMGEIERNANLNNSVAKWREKLIEQSSRLEHIRSDEKKRRQREEEEKAAALVRKQSEQKEQNNQASTNENREVDVMTPTKVVIFVDNGIYTRKISQL